MQGGSGPGTGCLCNGPELREQNSKCGMRIASRERQPWEAADGAVYLVRELAAAAPDTMPQLMPALAEAVRHNHYAHACHLQVLAFRRVHMLADRRSPPLQLPSCAAAGVQCVMLHRGIICENCKARPADLVGGVQETTWRQLPLIAQHLGKRGFKRHLEPFLDPLFMYALL